MTKTSKLLEVREAIIVRQASQIALLKLALSQACEELVQREPTLTEFDVEFLKELRVIY